MIFGGLETGSGMVLYIYENTGDNDFSEIWSYTMVYPDDGMTISCDGVVFAGDMDGDGKKEFIVGGIKAEPVYTLQFDTIYYLFEATGDNTFQKIAEFNKTVSMWADRGVNSGDLDGDGSNEIIISGENYLYEDGIHVFDSTGDNQYSEVWSHTWPRSVSVTQWLNTIGIGDHDSDGKAEIIFNEYSSFNVNTVVYERV